MTVSPTQTPLAVARVPTTRRYMLRCVAMNTYRERRFVSTVAVGRSARRATGLSKPGRLLRNLKARPRLWLRYGLRTHAELLAALRLE